MTTDTSCSTACKAFVTFSDSTTAFIGTLSTALNPGILNLFSSLTALWVLWKGMQLALGMINPLQILHELFWVIVASSLLLSQDKGLIKTAYDSTISLMSGASGIAGSLTNTSDIGSLKDLLKNTESYFGTVFSLGKQAIDQGSAANPLNWLAGINLMIPYMLLMIAYSSQLTVAVFRMSYLSLISPFIMMSIGFSSTRPMAVSWFRTILSTIMVLFAATLVVTIIVSFASSDLEKLKDSMYITTTYNNDSDANGSSTGIGNTTTYESKAPIYTLGKYWVLVALGWMSTALLAEGTALANSITGSVLTNVAAGIMTAGMGTAQIQAWRMAKGAGGIAASKGANIGAALGNKLDEVTGGNYRAAIDAIKDKFTIKPPPPKI